MFFRSAEGRREHRVPLRIAFMQRVQTDARPQLIQRHRLRTLILRLRFDDQTAPFGRKAVTQLNAKESFLEPAFLIPWGKWRCAVPRLDGTATPVPVFILPKLHGFRIENTSLDSSRLCRFPIHAFAPFIFESLNRFFLMLVSNRFVHNSSSFNPPFTFYCEWTSLWRIAANRTKSVRPRRTNSTIYLCGINGLFWDCDNPECPYFQRSNIP